MANKQDPLVESLMQLAVSAAPLIERARASGLFKPGSREASAASAASSAASSSAPPAADDPGKLAALQDIVVSQAIKIAALEAEVARLTAKLSPPS